MKSNCEGGISMYITYRDELGEVLVTVDEDGISFVNGTAYFSSSIEDDNTEYAIPVTDIISIFGE